MEVGQRNRDVELRPDEFKRIAVLVKTLTGMNYQTGKETLVLARLSSRLRALNKDSFHAYVDFVEKERSKAELGRMLNLLTTNKTSFFRENEHFEFLTETWIPQVEKRSSPKVRLWSSACSSGQEPYSMAMHLTETLSEKMLSRVRILGTDLSSDILKTAKRGIYPEGIINQLSNSRRGRFFTKMTGSPITYRANDSLRKMMHFSQLNLMNDWPMRGAFDVIFCRNVMIYFDKPTQERLVNRFWTLLNPGGYLLIGHSESLSGTKHPFTYVKPAVWAK